MPAKADSPLRKVTLNLYELDCQVLERRYGRGWSERVRKLVHEHAVRCKQGEKMHGMEGRYES